MFVYSGKCKMCEVGLDSDLIDVHERKLKTGDVVIVYKEIQTSTVEKNCVGIGVIAANHFKNVSGEKPSKRDNTNKIRPYVMGFSSGGTPWKIRLVKSYSDIVDGEKWSDYGFHFSSI